MNNFINNDTSNKYERTEIIKNLENTNSKNKKLEKISDSKINQITGNKGKAIQSKNRVKSNGQEEDQNTKNAKKTLQNVGKNPQAKMASRQVKSETPNQQESESNTLYGGVFVNDDKMNDSYSNFLESESKKSDAIAQKKGLSPDKTESRISAKVRHAKKNKERNQKEFNQLQTMSDSAFSVSKDMKSRRKLAAGSFKSVEKATVKHENTGKVYKSGQLKGVAVTEHNLDNATASKKNEIDIEVHVHEALKNNPEAARFTPKVLYMNQEGTKQIIITKLVNGGEASDILEDLPDQQKIDILLDVVKGASILKEMGIYHNDVAMRNILIHHPKKWVSLKEAVGKKIDRVYVPNTSQILFHSGHKLKKEDLQALKNLGISKVKIDSGERPQGKLTDFGICTIMKGDEIVIKSAFLPHDVTAPEMMVVTVDPITNKKKMGSSEQNSNESTQSFSLGQTIADAFLRPSQDTSLSPKENPDYNRAMFTRMLDRIEKSQSGAAGSALSQEEFEQLTAIDKDLGQLVNESLSYDPSKRPTLKNMEERLAKIQDRLRIQISGR